jgi:hypothetical protein
MLCRSMQEQGRSLTFERSSSWIVICRVDVEDPVTGREGVRQCGKFEEKS